jgi:hypothetical protein
MMWARCVVAGLFRNDKDIVADCHELDEHHKCFGVRRIETCCNVCDLWIR